MNRTIKTGCVLLSLVALATGGAWLARSHGDPSASADASRTPTAFGWQRGTRYLYDFDWTVRSASTVDMAGAGGGAGTMDASSESALHGQLAFKAYGQQGDAWLFGVSVSALHDVKLAAMGNALLDTPETIHDTFDGREAFVEVSARGEVRHLRFRAGDPALFKQLLQSVIAESQVVLGGAASAASAAAWQSIETYSVGKLEMHYAVDASDPLYLRRAPTRVLSATALPQGSADGLVPVLAGGSDVHLDRAGFVGSVATRLDLTIAPRLEHHTVFTMTFREKSEVDVPERFAVESVAAQQIEPGAAPEAPELRQRMDERFAAHTSQQEVSRMLTAYGKGLPPARGMLTATAAFLRLHPEACEAMATQFLDPALDGRSRELMVGLLASAGTPVAQAGMRRALEVPESRADLGVYGRMIQRLGFVTAPTRESLVFAVDLYDSPAIVGDPDLRRVTGLTLGALAAHASGPARALGDSIHARLVADVKAATSAEAKIALVAAVGNAARASDVPLLRTVAKESESNVRESVARALRGVDSPETRVALREMITDPSADVARAAARSYDARALEAADMTELAALANGGAISPAADASLVSVVQGHLDANKEASEQILEAVLARHPDGKGAGQIRLLLRRLRGES